MVESESLFVYPAITSESIQDSALVQELQRLFSLDNLEKDYSLVLSMNPDLWVHIEFLYNLESIRVLCLKKVDLIPACYKAGLEICSEFVRNKVEVPRKSIYVKSCPEVQQLSKDFNLESITQDDDTWILSFFSEPEAFKGIKALRSLGVECGIEYVSPYAYLLACVIKYVNEGPFLAVSHLFLNDSCGKEYSLSETKEVYKKYVVKMPSEFQRLIPLKIIRKSPKIIEILA